MIKLILNKVSYKIKKKYLFKDDPPIIVAGLARCGTTLTTNAIISSRGASFEYVSNLNQPTFTNGTVYKTHDYPDIEEFHDDLKTIFMFGNITNTIFSLNKLLNIHGVTLFNNFHSDQFQPNEQLYYDDILQLEKHFDAWYRPQKFSCISMRYESLYSEKTLNALNDYLGFKVKFPPYEKRSTNPIFYPEKNIVDKTYRSLAQKIDAAIDCKIWEPNSPRIQ